MRVVYVAFRLMLRGIYKGFDHSISRIHSCIAREIESTTVAVVGFPPTAKATGFFTVAR